eukprot:3479244-Pyramimonas_sp.AAC.1
MANIKTNSANRETVNHPVNPSKTAKANNHSTRITHMKTDNTNHEANSNDNTCTANLTDNETIN